MSTLFKLRTFLYLCMAILTAGQKVVAQDRSQGRSMVISKNGIVAAESPLAAQAGVRILENGGNAGDAAIATNAMMGVVEPMMNGIGGDLFAIVYDAKANKLYGLNASGWAPKGLTIEYLQKQGIRSMPQQGVNAITVPGVVDGWQKLADKFWRKIWPQPFVRRRTDFPCPNGPRRIGRRPPITCAWTTRQRRRICQVTMRPKWGKCFAILIWHGPSSRSRSTEGTRSTKARLRQRFWNR